MKPRTVWVVRLVISAAVLAFLFAFVSTKDLWKAICSVHIVIWLGVLSLFLLCHLVAAAKWWWLLRSYETIPLSPAIRAHFGGLVANLCLPGVAGGDLVRATWVIRKAKKRVGVGVASITDRLLDCTALLLITCISIVVTAELSGLAGQALVAVGAFLSLLAVAAVLVAWRFGDPSRDSFLGRVGQAARLLLRSPGILLRSLSLSLIVQGSFVGLNFWLGSAAGVEVSAVAWMAAWPLAKLTATLPVSLAGLGIREAALVAFMRPFGGTQGGVMAVGLLWQGVLFCGGLVGSLVIAVNNLMPMKLQPDTVGGPEVTVGQ